LTSCANVGWFSCWEKIKLSGDARQLRAAQQREQANQLPLNQLDTTADRPHPAKRQKRPTTSLPRDLSEKSGKLADFFDPHTYERLSKVKGEYDRANLFQGNFAV
jgi:hypothetical protein